MGLVRRGEEMAGNLLKPQGSFTGDADQRTIHVEVEPRPARVSFVRFQPGTTTHWHSHGGGQVLHVVDGEGRARNRGEEAIDLHQGDTLTVGPGVEHWHGAPGTTPMTHLAVTIGDVTWLEAPEL